MCVVSMIREHYQEGFDWSKLPSLAPHPEWNWTKWNEYQKLLEKAAEYDKKTGQPDCEEELKKKIDGRIEEYLRSKFGPNIKETE